MFSVKEPEEGAKRLIGPFRRELLIILDVVHGGDNYQRYYSRMKALPTGRDDKLLSDVLYQYAVDTGECELHFTA